MSYTELVTVIMGISLVLYVITGGADFGAGIIELLLGDKEKRTVTRAIAPVWEANHIWLIIAVVILFNGFSEAYALFTTVLHIPTLLILLGIICRGAAFTFRHYDAYKGQSQQWYSYVFRYSSAFTVLFLGITVAALFAGTIPPSMSGSFFDYYIVPWANLFCLSTGIFLAILSAYIAGIFLMGEVEDDNEYQLLARFTRRLFIGAVVSGLLVLISSMAEGRLFHTAFIDHPFTLVCGIVATLLVPFVFVFIKKRSTWRLRLLVGMQIGFILMGWLVVQWPNLISFSDGSKLTIYDAAAPAATMRVLFWVLAVGVVLIFPALFYLFKIFKTNR